MDKEDLEKIKNETEDFFKRATIEAEINVGMSEEDVVDINLNTEDPEILIGEKGQTLAEIQRVLKIILVKKLGKQFFINLDINNYKKKKIEYLKELANSTADAAVLTKEERELDPMLAYERRIIHLELAGRADVATYSAGEGSERRVVIKPIDKS